MGDGAATSTVDLASWRDRLLDTLQDDAGNPGGPRAAIPAAAARVELLAFGLGTETYGIDIGEVAEILLPRPVTPLPRAPAFVQGLVSLRGTVLPVLDLARRLGLPGAEPTRTSRIVVLKDGDEHMGFWVDRVTGVIRFSPGEIEPTGLGLPVDARYLKGIGYDRKGGLVAVLRPEALCDFSVDAP